MNREPTEAEIRKANAELALLGAEGVKAAAEMGIEITAEVFIAEALEKYDKEGVAMFTKYEDGGGS